MLGKLLLWVIIMKSKEMEKKRRRQEEEEEEEEEEDEESNEELHRVGTNRCICMQRHAASCLFKPITCREASFVSNT